MTPEEVRGVVKQSGYHLREIAVEANWSENYLHQQLSGRRRLQAESILAALLRLQTRQAKKRSLLRQAAQIMADAGNMQLAYLCLAIADLPVNDAEKGALDSTFELEVEALCPTS